MLPVKDMIISTSTGLRLYKQADKITQYDYTIALYR